MDCDYKIEYKYKDTSRRNTIMLSEPHLRCKDNVVMKLVLLMEINRAGLEVLLTFAPGGRLLSPSTRNINGVRKVSFIINKQIQHN